MEFFLLHILWARVVNNVSISLLFSSFVERSTTDLDLEWRPFTRYSIVLPSSYAYATKLIRVNWILSVIRITITRVSTCTRIIFEYRRTYIFQCTYIRVWSKNEINRFDCVSWSIIILHLHCMHVIRRFTRIS